MAKLNHIEYFKRALLDFITEADPLYSMLIHYQSGCNTIRAQRAIRMLYSRDINVPVFAAVYRK